MQCKMKDWCGGAYPIRWRCVNFGLVNFFQRRNSGGQGNVRAMPPGVPRDRVRSVEAAFLKTLKDPEFAAEGEKSE
jgi:hypothetical protein